MAQASDAPDAKPAAPAGVPAVPARQTVILRAGPKPKGGAADVVIGAVGLLLLLSTVGLAVVLPHKDVAPRQYSIVYEDQVTDIIPSRAWFFTTEGESHTFEYNVTDDDVFLIEFRYEFKDNVASSDPDTFSIQVYDPNSNPVVPQVLATNYPGIADNSSQLPVNTVYKAQLMSGLVRYSVPKPDDGVSEVTDPALSAPALEAQLEQKAHIDTKGTWKVKVSMTVSGDCPTASKTNNTDSGQRFAACVSEMQAMQQNNQATAQQAAGGKDPGNKFSADVFSYTTFKPTATLVDAGAKGT